MLSKKEVVSLCRGEHGDPFSLLGLHTDAKGRLWLRSLQPGANAVSAIDPGTGQVIVELTQRKIDVLRRDARVGFSTAVDVRIIRERSTTHFRSLCGPGRVSEVTDTEEKRRALDAISLRFDARCPRPAPDAALARVNILRIDVESLTCRHKNGPRRKDKE